MRDKQTGSGWGGWAGPRPTIAPSVASHSSNAAHLRVARPAAAAAVWKSANQGIGHGRGCGSSAGYGAAWRAGDPSQRPEGVASRADPPICRAVVTRQTNFKLGEVFCSHCPEASADGRGDIVQAQAVQELRHRTGLCHCGYRTNRVPVTTISWTD